MGRDCSGDCGAGGIPQSAAAQAGATSGEVMRNSPLLLLLLLLLLAPIAVTLGLARVLLLVLRGPTLGRMRQGDMKRMWRQPFGVSALVQLKE